MTKLNLSVPVMTALMLSACGGQPIQPNTTNASIVVPQGGSNPYSSQQVLTSQVTPASSSNTSNIPSDPYDFQIFGVNLTDSTTGNPLTPDKIVIQSYNQKVLSTTIETDNILKIDITSTGVANFGNFTAVFNCIKIPVFALGITQIAFVSTTGQPGTGVCAGAQPTATLDFSKYIPGQHGAITVAIKPNPGSNSYMYFDNCHSSPSYIDTSVYPYAYVGYRYPGCGLNPVPGTYSVPGHVEIHTNGTQ